MGHRAGGRVVSVVLSGRRDGTTAKAVALLASLPDELRLIGGLAVMCRVGTPHRATVDLDAVTRGLAQCHDAIASLAVTAPGGGQYTFEGDFDLDVIDVAPQSGDELVRELLAHDEPMTDLDFNVVAHSWAHDTATPIDIVAVEEGAGVVLAQAPGRFVASAAGLVAMKASTIPLRSSSKPEKRASDLYDLGRLLVVGDVTAEALDAMPVELRDVVMERIIGWFMDDAGRDRTYREVRRFDEPRLDLDEVADAVAALTGDR